LVEQELPTYYKYFPFLSEGILQINKYENLKIAIVSILLVLKYSLK